METFEEHKASCREYLESLNGKLSYDKEEIINRTSQQIEEMATKSAHLFVISDKIDVKLKKICEENNLRILGYQLKQISLLLAHKLRSSNTNYDKMYQEVIDTYSKEYGFGGFIDNIDLTDINIEDLRVTD